MSQIPASEHKGVTKMSELLPPISEAKSNLHELEGLLQKFRAHDPDHWGSPLLTQEEFQGYFNEILRIVENIPENLRLEDSLQWNREISRLHSDLEEANNKFEFSIQKLESICERNVKQLSQFIETLDLRENTHPTEAIKPEPNDSLEQLMNEGQESLANRNYEACMRRMEEILAIEPGHVEAGRCLKEAQSRWEDHRLEEELAIHIENLKKEAIDLFDKERFKECAGIFKFLCELNPQDRNLQDYLHLTRQKLEESGEKAWELKKPELSQAEAPKVALPNQVRPIVTQEEWKGSSADLPSGMVVPLMQPDHSTPEAVYGGIEETRPDPEMEEHDSSPAAHFQAADEEEEPSKVQDERNQLAEATEAAPPKRQWLVMASAACVVLGALLGALIFQFTRNSVSMLEVQSDPEGAKVFVDGQFKGLTPYQTNSQQVGNCTIRLERDGYTPEAQTLFVKSGEPAKWAVTLKVSELKSMTASDLQKTAQELFDREKYIEASDQCDLILRQEPKRIRLDA
ncbi:MAG: PEGA domain-containing protein [Terriglobia bacterium]